ncbi:MAG: hypothetical protein HYZ84_07350 [Candidatus Omnitrophica bacterium]|nr:hypothetical protein [Candidatus Omnitrophota bacterium]
MKKLSVILASFLFLTHISGIAFAQEEVETEYSYGTVKSVSGAQIIVSEYDFEKDADVDVTYTTDASTQFEGVAAIGEVGTGDDIEIDYVVKGGNKNATLVSIEKAAAAEAVPAAAPVPEVAPEAAVPAPEAPAAAPAPAAETAPEAAKPAAQ